MAEPIVVEDLMRILTTAARAVETNDMPLLELARREMDAIERPEDAHGWDTTKVALYALRCIESIAEANRQKRSRF